jgi:hypothetical protein
LLASTAEGPGEPVRHRYNLGGNRRVPTDTPRRRPGASSSGTLSDIIYRRMTRDLAAADRASLSAQPLLAA